MKRLRLFIACLLALLLLGLFTPSPAGAATCSRPWGSTPEQAGELGPAPVVNVRAGRHRCYDRMVVDLAGDVTGYAVRYVPEVVQDGSGKPVPLRGRAFLQVVVLSPAYDEDGNPTYFPANMDELVDVSGYRVFRQIAWAGSFEGQTTIGLGVRARLPFRVFTLAGPGEHSRIVIDVARRW